MDKALGMTSDDPTNTGKHVTSTNECMWGLPAMHKKDSVSGLAQIMLCTQHYLISHLLSHQTSFYMVQQMGCRYVNYYCITYLLSIVKKYDQNKMKVTVPMVIEINLAPINSKILKVAFQIQRSTRHSPVMKWRKADVVATRYQQDSSYSRCHSGCPFRRHRYICSFKGHTSLRS